MSKTHISVTAVVLYCDGTKEEKYFLMAIKARKHWEDDILSMTAAVRVISIIAR